MIIAFVLLLVGLRIFYLVAEMCYERDWPRATWRGLITALVLLLVCGMAFGQTAARIDIPLQTAGPNVPSSPGPLPQVLWVANSTAYLCASPSATLAACQASLITTYTDVTLGTACPSNAQLVQLPGNTCTAFTGVTSNIGAWVAQSSLPFDYWIVSTYGTFGPFTFSPATGSSIGCPTAGCTFTGPINLSSDLPTGHQAASANAAVVVNSVLAYGAVHDEQTTAGGACSVANSSATLTCPSSTFTSADVGKLALLLPTSGSCPIPGTLQASGLFTLCTATISTFTDSAHVVLNQNATASVAVTIRWGTDDVPAANACAAVGNVTCKIPAGPYFMGSAPYYTLTGAYDDGSYGTPAGGSGAVITATLGSGGTAGRIASYTISSGGSGYTPNSSLQMGFSGGGCPGGIYNNGPCGSAFAYATTNSSGVVTGVTSVYAGFGFAVAPTITVIPLGGDGAAAHVTVSAGSINATVIDAAGAGYATGTMQAYGIGGTGCAAVTNYQNVSTITVTAVGTATLSGGGVTAIAWTGGSNNPGSGCSGAPTVIFGPYVCGASLNAQCTNLAPLSPIAIPVQVMMPAFVNWEGPSTNQGLFGQTAALIGAWDQKTVDANQPAMFGSPLYIQDLSMNGFAVENSYWGLHSPFSMATAKISNMTWSSDGIGMYFGAMDLGSQLQDNTCFAYACYVGGGRWGTRLDNPGVGGGFFNSQTNNNTVIFSSPYDSVSKAIDDWFAANFWHPEFSTASLDFPEVCKFPQTPNQRQTSNAIKFNFPGNTTGNTMCYPGVTQSGVVELARNNGGNNLHNVTNVTMKSGTRYLYYGIFTGGVLDGFGGGEGSDLITGTNDPYRTATLMHAPIVYPNWQSTSPNTTVRNLNFLPRSGTFSNSLWGLGSATGLPVGGWQNLAAQTPVSNPPSLNGDNVANQLTTSTIVTTKVTAGGFNALLVTSFPVGALGPMVLFNCPSGISICTGTQPTWNTNGVFMGVVENPVSSSADIFDLYSVAGASELYSLAADGGITNTGANAFNGSTKFGGSGSAFSAKYKGTGTLTYGAITAPACAEQPLTITGAAAGDACYASTGATDIGITFQYGGCRMSAANTAQVKVCATVTGTPTAVTWIGWSTH